MKSAKAHPLTDMHHFGNLAARSPRMAAVFDTLSRLSCTDVTVTLVGDTGTGKDVLAQTLHEQSRRAQGPLVVFDCSAVAATLVESELFGHERGAFTGAVAPHPGAFERAHGGTLFLDEIGDMALHLQSRLLRALEARKVRRVGGSSDRAIDVRIIAATHRDLRDDVEQEHFRRDLYFRLAEAVVTVPRLRERVEDIPMLVERLLVTFGRGDIDVSEAALDRLRAHDWPGNVRELKNALGYAIAVLDPHVSRLEPEHLPHPLSRAEHGRDAGVDALPLSGRTLSSLECAAIGQTLRHAKGNRARAAETLGIPVSKLEEKLREYGLVGV